MGPNCYYIYLANKKFNYYKKREVIYERIKYVNNNRTVGYRTMRIFLQRYGIYLSNYTVHKYMNQQLNLTSVIMRKHPKYKSCKKQKIFDNLLNQNFTVNDKE